MLGLRCQGQISGLNCLKVGKGITHHEINKKREISDAIKQAIRDMSDITKQAIKDMPVHFENDQERDDYYIAHADKFVTQYKTNKTNISEKWDNIEDASKAARFAAA